METVAIIVAAGLGRRMGAPIPKTLIPVAGKPLLIHTLIRFDLATLVDKVVVVTSKMWLDDVKQLIAKNDIRKVDVVIPGGAERQDSVRCGFDACNANTCEIVLVHDAARPLVTPAEIDAVIETARQYGAAILGAPLKETIKQVKGNTIEKTVDRRVLWGAQTPQAFRYDVFAEAVSLSQKDQFLGTDEASLVERTGVPVVMVQGHYNNIKVTTPEDLLVAEVLLKEKE